MEYVLDVKDVTKQFGGLSAVSNLSMQLAAGELVGLIGPNGAGKTTFFNLLTGVYVPTSGTINLRVDHQMRKINGMKPYKIASMGLARTFQNIRLFTNLTVLENVLVSLHPDDTKQMIASILRLPSHYKQEQSMREEALKLLQIFGLDSKSEEIAGKLAYGQQRCLEIVRALATKPRILFLDEPAAGMNPQETEELTHLIHQIQQDFNITILLIEHDMSLVMKICTRLYVLEYGRLIAQGTPEEIRNNPAVIAAYLGGDVK